MAPGPSVSCCVRAMSDIWISKTSNAVDSSPDPSEPLPGRNQVERPRTHVRDRCQQKGTGAGSTRAVHYAEFGDPNRPMGERRRVQNLRRRMHNLRRRPAQFGETHAEFEETPCIIWGDASCSKYALTTLGHTTFSPRKFSRLLLRHVLKQQQDRQSAAAAVFLWADQ